MSKLTKYLFVISIVVASAFLGYRYMASKNALPDLSQALVITSDTHLSTRGGRWPTTSDNFKQFVQSLQNNPPERLFIVGDIVDNVVRNKQKVQRGDKNNWQAEIDIYHTIQKQLPQTKFLQSLGTGPDFGAIPLADAEATIGAARGVDHWRGYDLIWLSPLTGTSSITEGARNPPAFDEYDYRWLKSKLAETEKAILLFHVPLRSDATLKAGNFGGRNLTIDPNDPIDAIINTYSNKIAAIFNGHIHAAIRSHYRGIPLHICPFYPTGCHCSVQTKANLLKVSYHGCIGVRNE